MNPIIRRELLELLRTRKAVALQVTLALACIVLILVRWPSGEISDLSGARSLQVLRVFGYGLLAGILLLVPAYPATSLVREKIKGTLALLLNSPMRPSSIYVGKLGGVLGFTTILLVMTLPAAAACHALGGTVVRGGIGTLYAVLGVASLQLATLGLLVSSRAQSTDGALRVTYGLVLVVSVLTLVPHALLRGEAGLPFEIASWLRCLSPIPAVMEVLGQGDVGAQGFIVGFGVLARYLLLASIMSLICALATIARLNHTILDRARSAGVITEDRSLGGQVARSLVFMVDPQKRSGSMTLWVNPVMVKEFRSRRFGRLHWTIRLVAVSAILSLCLSLVAASGAVGWGVEIVGGALVLLQITLLILFAPSLAAGLISSERESGSWQLLRMNPLSAGKILRGKLVSVALPPSRSSRAGTPSASSRPPPRQRQPPPASRANPW
jgi:ABC-type transport system involved in multi-copper enzyme maturation permease subunit